MSFELCRNCGASLHGRYCHACGQRATDVQLTLHDVLHEATHEFLHLDGKIVQTLKLLVFRPGALTQEFLAGRRARYISPIRVYLTCSILFFALAASLPGSQSGFITIRATPDAPGAAVPKNAGTFAERFDRAAKKATSEQDRFRESIMHQAPRVAFVLMPFYALLTWGFYRRAQPYYVPHLYYSVHFHAFVFLILCGYVLLTAIGEIGKQAGQLLFAAAVFPYHYVSLRRVFGGTRLQAAVRGTAIGFLYWIAIGLTMAALMLVLLLRL